jgi:hypothetical protein
MDDAGKARVAGLRHCPDLVEAKLDSGSSRIKFVGLLADEDGYGWLHASPLGEPDRSTPT